MIYQDAQVVDQTVTSGTNGLRMPYCDKAQRSAVGLVGLVNHGPWRPLKTLDARILKREFLERKQRGEFFTERELMDQHAYLKEEASWLAPF